MNGSLLGIDVGGTYTDFLLIDTDGRAAVHKILNGRSATRAAVQGARELVPQPATVWSIIHGTTVATNAVLERTGARTVLVVTRGFRDVLELQRQDRSDVWDLRYRKPLPLVPRDRRVEVDERLAADGSVITPIDADAAASRVLDLVDESGSEAVAICFLHSYRNGAHEKALACQLRALRPGLHVSVSHEIAPQYREYERMSTAALSAYLGPVVRQHASSLASSLKAEGFSAPVLIMQSNGGVIPAEAAAQSAATLCLSGPAGGVLAATKVAQSADIRNLICLDMGGTSTDVALVKDGRPEVAYDTAVDGLPTVLPALRIETVGAGGGSVIYVDEAGLLQSGPRSVGADPGPACYGNGGSQLTVTDAWCALGVLREKAGLDSYLHVNESLALKAAEPIAAELGVSVRHLCWQALRVTTANMGRALHLVAVEQGNDPRDFTIVCYGGAGGLHAALCADELGVRQVLVPVASGVLSAYGMVCADLSRSYVRTQLSRLDSAASAIEESIADMAAQAYQEFSHWGRPETPALRPSLDLRYAGQAHEIRVEIAPGEPVMPQAISDQFHQAHEQRYGFCERESTVEIVNVRLNAVVGLQAPELADTFTGPAEEFTARTVLSDEADTRFLARTSMRAGQPVAGPAVIEEATSTTVVPSGWRAERDERGYLWLTRN